MGWVEIPTTLGMSANMTVLVYQGWWGVSYMPWWGLEEEGVPVWMVKDTTAHKMVTDSYVMGPQRGWQWVVVSTSSSMAGYM